MAIIERRWVKLPGNAVGCLADVPVTEMISFGAGWNSTADTIIEVNDGWRGPIVFADTGGEHPETYCYLHYFEDNWLKPRGLEITRIGPQTHPELYEHRAITEDGGRTLEQFCLVRGIIPLVTHPWCSVEYKRKPLTNWRNAHGISVTIQGIAVDEDERRVHANDPTLRYPLVDRSITRAECGRIIRREGLDLPIKSGCFFCPQQGIGKWKRLYLDHPDLYERAIAIEDNASAHDQKWATLSDTGFSLRQMAARRFEGMVEMDLSDWLPCACRL